MTGKPKILRSFFNLTSYLREANIKHVYLFVGNGPRVRYRELDKVCETLYPTIDGFEKPWLAAFGGDSYVEDRSDLGAIMKRLKEKFDMPLLAVQCWNEVDGHVDLIYRYPKLIYDEDSSLSWGGVTREGKIVGGTAIYLSDEWTANETFTLTVINVGSKGKVGTQEIAYAKSRKLTMIEIDAEPGQSKSIS